ncbi:MAG: PAS domain-containing sensor histidine kinase, partial [Candidatus Dormibacteria bacterium]
ILATSPQAILNLRVDGTVASANRSALRVLGYGQEAEIRGRSHLDLVRYEESQTPNVLSHLVESSDPYYKAQHRAVRQDGSEFWADLTVVLVRDSAAEPGFFYVIIEDISERLAAVEALRESRERISVIIGNAPLILFALDAGGEVTLSEGRGLATIGRKPGELVGTSIYELYGDNPEIISGLERAMRGESGGRVLQLPGSDVVLDIRFAPIRDDGGMPRGVIGVAFDITEQRRAERQREEAQEKLRQSHERLRLRGRERRRLMASLVTIQEEERRQIANGIHDDTLQVLSNLGFHLERLRRRSEARGADTDVLDHLDRSLQMAVDRLRRLVFDLRPTSLDEEGIFPTLKQLLGTFGVETGITTELTGAVLTEPEGPTRAALYRIAREAVMNVRKHSSARRCEVSVEEIEGWYRLVVRDDGGGFDTLTPEAPGHIGLRSIAEHTTILGGHMEIRSSPAEGTVLIAWVPGAGSSVHEVEADG